METTLHSLHTDSETPRKHDIPHFIQVIDTSAGNDSDTVRIKKCDTPSDKDVMQKDLESELSAQTEHMFENEAHLTSQGCFTQLEGREAAVFKGLESLIFIA